MIVSALQQVMVDIIIRELKILLGNVLPEVTGCCIEKSNLRDTESNEININDSLKATLTGCCRIDMSEYKITLHQVIGN